MTTTTADEERDGTPHTNKWEKKTKNIKNKFVLNGYPPPSHSKACDTVPINSL